MPRDAIEGAARELGRCHHRQPAVVDHPDVEACGCGRLPEGHVEPVCDRLDRVELPVQLGSRVGGRGEQADRVARPHFALDEDPRVHPRVERVGQDGDATRPAIGERVGDRVTRHVRLADLEDERVRRSPPGSRPAASPTRSPRSSGSRRPLPVRWGGRRPGPGGSPRAAKRATARCGPPWTVSWRWASPSSPNGPTQARSTRSFGTPPGETLTWTTRPVDCQVRTPVPPDGRVTSGTRRSASPGSGRGGRPRCRAPAPAGCRAGR